jgi:hypothetical protein
MGYVCAHAADKSLQSNETTLVSVHSWVSSVYVAGSACSGPVQWRALAD